MSAVAPARRPSITTGRLAAVCISAISSGDGVSTGISHVPAVSCIQPPRFEIVEAIHSLRKSADCNGSKPVVCFSITVSGAGTGGGLGVGENGMNDTLSESSTRNFCHDTGQLTYFVFQQTTDTPAIRFEEEVSPHACESMANTTHSESNTCQTHNGTVG